MNNNYSRQIGSTVKILRLSKGKKQSEVASDIEMTTRHFQRIEAGQVDLKSTTAKEIASVLNAEPCYLFREDHLKSSESCGIACPREILDLLPVGIQVCDAKGEVTYLNRKQMKSLGHLDWKKNEKPLYIWDFLANQHEIESLKSYFHFLLTTQPKPTPYYMHHFNTTGGNLPVRVEWDYIRNGRGNVTGFVSVISVVSEGRAE